MKVGISLEDENGLYSNVCKHFQESSHLFILDVDKNKIISTYITTRSPFAGSVSAKI